MLSCRVGVDFHRTARLKALPTALVKRRAAPLWHLARIARAETKAIEPLGSDRTLEECLTNHG
jgi:hypothetical protein